MSELSASLGGPRAISDPEAQTIENLARHVAVRRAGKSHVIEVEVSTHSPAKSARITNAVLDAYLDYLAKAHTEEDQRITALIESRLESVLKKIRLAETTLNGLRRPDELPKRGKISDTTKQDTDPATPHSAVSDSLAQRDAALTSALERRPDLRPEAIQSDHIQRLRDQYSQVARREAALSRKLKRRHPDLIDVRAQLRGLQRQMDEEVARIAASAQIDSAAARARMAEIQRATDRRKDEVSRMVQAEVRAVEQELLTTRDILTSLTSQTNKRLDQTHLAMPKASVISPATVPIRQSFPAPLPFLALGGLVGFAVGLGRVILGNVLDKNARHTDTLRSTIDHWPVRVTLPLLASSKSMFMRVASWFSDGDDQNGFADILQAVSAPSTRSAKQYQQSIRRLQNILICAKPATAAFISSRSGTGASSTALAVAYSAALSGVRTLLVDASSCNADLSNEFATRLEPGTVIVLDRREDLASVTSCLASQGPSILPIALADVRWLTLNQRRRLRNGLAELSQSYDFVVIDCGSLLEDESALTLLPLVENVLVVVRHAGAQHQELQETADVAASSIRASARVGIVTLCHP